MRTWVLLAIGLFVVLGLTYWLITRDRPSTAASSKGGLQSVRQADGKGRPCTPKEIADLTRRHELGTLKPPYGCDTAGVNFGSLPISPEWRFAAQIAGIQPLASRAQCDAYAYAGLGSLYDSAADRKRFNEQVCGWERGRPGCSYADRFTYGDRGKLSSEASFLVGLFLPFK